MKLISIFIFSLFLLSCTAEQAEEFTFRKTIEHELLKLCKTHAKEKACTKAVKNQIVECMKKSDWHKLVDNAEDKAEQNRFINAFYPCFVDSRGNPYFRLN